ncbi:hypothetical protein CEXT_205541, partial [Caerostris extrusa]
MEGLQLMEHTSCTSLAFGFERESRDLVVVTEYKSTPPFKSQLEFTSDTQSCRYQSYMYFSDNMVSSTNFSIHYVSSSLSQQPHYGPRYMWHYLWHRIPIHRSSPDRQAP